MERIKKTKKDFETQKKDNEKDMINVPEEGFGGETPKDAGFDAIYERTWKDSAQKKEEVTLAIPILNCIDDEPPAESVRRERISPTGISTRLRRKTEDFWIRPGNRFEMNR